MSKANASSWHIYQGTNVARPGGPPGLKPPPPWRTPKGAAASMIRVKDLETDFQPFLADDETKHMVNASLLLRRPLLVTGHPGTGKTRLAYAVSHELNLGRVLRWSINTRSTLREGLYDYDAVGRLHAIAPRHHGVPACGG
jgi:MoxR-like ATPase